MLFDKLKRLVREPLFQFLCIGTLIYGLYSLSSGEAEPESERRVTVSAKEVESLNEQWIRLWNRPPTEQEFAAVLRDHVRRQVLSREAVAMGLDQDDIVIQRRLAQKVELLAQGLSTPAEPDDAVLQDWYKANPAAFQTPNLYSVTHIFFDPDKRDQTTLDDAQAALDELRGLSTPPADYSAWGDRFMLQNYYPDRSEVELRKLFGSGFVDTLVKLEPGSWHGPVLSGYGTHLVFVHHVIESSPPAFEDVRAPVRDAWMAEQVTTRSERFIADLLDRYEVVVEETEVPLTAPGIAANP